MLQSLVIRVFRQTRDFCFPGETSGTLAAPSEKRRWFGFDAALPAGVAILASTASILRVDAVSAADIAPSLPLTAVARLPRLLAATLWLGAVAWGAEPMPSPPADGIHDETRALSADAHRRLAREAASLRAQSGIQLHFAAEAFLPSGASIRSHATKIRNRWSGQDGVLFLYVRGVDAHHLSFAPRLWQRYPAVSLLSAAHESAKIMSHKEQPLEDRLRRAVAETARRLRAMERQHLSTAMSTGKHHLRLARGFLLLLLGGAAFSALLGTRSRRLNRLRESRCSFPEVAVASRLGAPFGGGVIVTAASSPPLRPHLE